MVQTRQNSNDEPPAARIHGELHIDTLEALEVAAHDGRLESVPGIGRPPCRGHSGQSERTPRPPSYPGSAPARNPGGRSAAECGQ
jgi:hypothetical protein